MELKNNKIMHDYDVLFLSGLFPNGHENEILKNSKKNVQNAANNLQWSLVKGLDVNLKGSLTLLNSIYIGSFPFLYKKPFIRSYRFSHMTGAEDINAGFLNVPLLKHLSRRIGLRKYLHNWIVCPTDRKRLVIAYAATPVMVKSLNYVKELDKSVATCLIVPDLPEYMNIGNKNRLYKRVKDLAIPSLYKEMSNIDSFVYLTEAMSKRVAPKKPYVVVEGIATAAHPPKIYNKNKLSGITTFLYTGGINEDYGVTELVKVFSQIDNTNIRLQICGDGIAVGDVMEYCRIDNRIDYLGLLPHSQVLDLQVKADFLINPRRNLGEFTKYSFPSKTLEYLASGTPTISYMLDGFPEEYRKYLLVVEGPCGLKGAIENALKLPCKSVELIGVTGASFVLDEKSSEVQTAKILKMINRL